MAPESADPTKASNRVEAADETTPLLNAPESGVPSEQQNGNVSQHSANRETAAKQSNVSEEDETEDEQKPMPYAQILLLCYASIAEPVAYFAIFPFINEMIERKGGVPEKDVGFWSGTIESLFSLVQMVLMIFYGRAADRLGRKPVLVFSLTGIGIATCLFGMCQSLWQMILTRCLAGIFAGSVVTVRTMISELTTKETQGRAFSWYMFARNFGIFLGPVVGGGLANPAEQFPRIFGGVSFWEKYPYALATYLAGAIVLSSALLTFLFVNETLKRKQEGQSELEPPMSTWQVLNSPGVPIVLYIFGHIMLLALMFTAIIPVYMYTSVANGGLGFSDQRIALFLAIGGGSQAFWMLVPFPWLQKKFGTGSLLKAVAIGWPIDMSSWMLMNEFLRAKANVAFWIFALLINTLGAGVAMAFACIQLCINDISPSPNVLGTLNALALTVNSGIRAVAPVFGTSLFATGVKLGWANGHLAWLVLVAFSVMLPVACRFLPEAAAGKPKKPPASE